eukprot:467897-Hanusia_phi.AAC.1
MAMGPRRKRVTGVTMSLSATTKRWQAIVSFETEEEAAAALTWQRELAALPRSSREFREAASLLPRSFLDDLPLLSLSLAAPLVYAE